MFEISKLYLEAYKQIAEPLARKKTLKMSKSLVNIHY